MRPKTSPRTRRKIPALAAVLKYRNERVIHGFRRMYRVPVSQARELFRETLKWLWLSQKVPGLVIYRENYAMDEMWHQFILHTKDYEAFCQKFFGEFAHHEPETYKRPDKPVKMSARERAEFERDVDMTIDAVVEELGKATALKWYATFPKKYSKAYLDKHRVA